MAGDFEMEKLDNDYGYDTMENDQLVDESDRLEGGLDPLNNDTIIDDDSKVEEYESRLSALRPILESRGLIGEANFIDDNQGGVTIMSKDGDSSLNVRCIATNPKGMGILMRTKLSELNKLFTKNGEIDKRRTKLFKEFRGFLTRYLESVFDLKGFISLDLNISRELIEEN